MKFRIHFIVDGFEDCIVVEGATLDEIRKKTEDELYYRGNWHDAWSEEIEADV